MNRRRGWTTFGIGVATGVAAYAVIGTGVLAPGTRGVADLVGGLVGAQPAAAAQLPAFEDCEQLRKWYVDEALPLVGPWGLDGPRIGYFATERLEGGAVGVAGPDGVVEDSAGSPDQAVGSSGTGTNVQETGVDEADIAKTNGRLVVRIVDHDLVVTDVSGPQPVELSRTRLPGPPLAQPELLLDGDRVLVVGEQLQRWFGGAIVDSERRILPPLGIQQQRTQLIALDIADPAHPRVTTRQSVDGGSVTARTYGDGTVRVVVSTSHPVLDFVQPTGGVSEDEALAKNRQIVENAPVEAWLPMLHRPGQADRPLLDCSDVRHPVRGAGLGTLSVLTLPDGDPEAMDATAVTAAGQVVYSSADRLYVATRAADEIVPYAPDRLPAPQTGRTQVHAFALEDGRTSYAASGTVAGTVKDRWSFDEQDGLLRVATTLDGPRDGTSVVVLEEDGQRLRPVGRVTGLGRGEDLQSVRWFGDLAVLVTFRQVDPLYTVDLSDPTDPRLLGALKVPGYSAYLHPLGDDLLLGIGQDVAVRSGVDLGGQAATFDIRDLRAVRRLDTVGFGAQSTTSVWDPRTFTYLPEERTFVTAVQDWNENRSWFVAVHVDADGSLTRTAAWPTRRYAGDTVRSLPIGEGRVALVGDEVRLVDVR